MGKKEVTMSEALDEILFNKKPKKTKKPLEEKKADLEDILEQDNSNTDEDDEENTDEDDEAAKVDKADNDAVLEVTLKVNEHRANVQLTKDDYEGRAITDFVSLISLFKKSKNLRVKEFLNQLTTAGATDQGATPSTEPQAGEVGLETPDQPQAETPEEGFKLSSFSLRAFERASQEDNIDVSIAGEENVNDMMSFKVSLGEDSTAFNTPESALAHFNRIFFDNVIKTIDKELEKRSE